MGLILDDLGNAAAAYSVRKLRTGATQCMQVRRSSDSTLQDIGFTSNELDTASLLTFCGSGSGYVAKWYDQTGNGNDAVQATAGSQPQIVLTGSTLTIGGKPALYFANGPYLRCSTPTFVNTAETIGVVARFSTTADTTQVIFDGASNAAYVIVDGSTQLKLGYPTVVNIGGAITTSQFRLCYKSTAYRRDDDASDQSLSGQGSNSMDGVTLGELRLLGVGYALNNGSIQEFIRWNSASISLASVQTAVRAYFVDGTVPSSGGSSSPTNYHGMLGVMSL